MEELGLSRIAGSSMLQVIDRWLCHNFDKVNSKSLTWTCAVCMFYGKAGIK